jgi:hypothetical protein
VGAALPKVTDSGIAVAAMDLLRIVPDEQLLPPERIELVRRAAREFAHRHPDTMQFAMIALLVGTAQDAPLSATELDEIERVSRCPTARTAHFKSVYERALRTYRIAGIPNPEGTAFGAAVGSIAMGGDLFVLRKRIDASLPHLSETDKRRVADSLWRIGEAVINMPTVLERLVGAGARKKAAELIGDDERVAEADRNIAHSRAVLSEVHKLNVDGWPLPSLHGEMLAAAVENEFGAMQAVVEPIPPPKPINAAPPVPAAPSGRLPSPSPASRNCGSGRRNTRGRRPESRARPHRRVM